MVMFSRLTEKGMQYPCLLLSQQAGGGMFTPTPEIGQNGLLLSIRDSVKTHPKSAGVFARGVVCILVFFFADGFMTGNYLDDISRGAAQFGSEASSLLLT